MHPIFIGHGPMFKQNFVSPQFRIVDIYEMMCHILDVTPAVNNGSFENVKQVFAAFDGTEYSSYSYTFGKLNV